MKKKFRVVTRDNSYPFDTYEDAEAFAQKAQEVDPTTRIEHRDGEAWEMMP